MYLSKAAQYIILLLRVSLGWFFVYDGFLKFTSTNWSILPQISGSHIALQFYNMLATNPILPILNQWYPILLIVAGAMILTGLWIRIGGSLGIILLILTYLPKLQFPHVGTTAYIVDHHIIFILAIGTLLAVHADQFWGLGADVRINK